MQSFLNVITLQTYTFLTTLTPRLHGRSKRFFRRPQNLNAPRRVVTCPCTMAPFVADTLVEREVPPLVSEPNSGPLHRGMSLGRLSFGVISLFFCYYQLIGQKIRCGVQETNLRFLMCDLAKLTVTVVKVSVLETDAYQCRALMV